MFVIEKPELSEELLVHFGVKGMKWGKRQSKSVTGISRSRGALLDKNARTKSRIDAALKGDKSRSPVRQRAALKLGQTLLGKERVGRLLQNKVDNLSAQDARVKSGQLKLADRLDVFNNVSVLGLLASNTPDK